MPVHGGQNYAESYYLSHGGDPVTAQQFYHPNDFILTEPFNSPDIQRFLPSSLQSKFTDPMLQSGIQGIGELLRNPGQLSPTVSSSIMPRLSEESNIIGQNFAGLQSNQAGMAGRTNQPTSIKNALASALGVAQERAQRSARNDALSSSDALRRSDLSQTYKLLNTILSFVQSGKGQAIQQQGVQVQQDAAAQQRQAAQQAMIASIIIAMASSSKFKKDFRAVSGEGILDKVRSVPVYEWSYKGDTARHVGPMAEDFLATFGLGGDPDKIHVVDAVGTLLAATQALARKVEHLESAR